MLTARRRARQENDLSASVHRSRNRRARRRRVDARDDALGGFQGRRARVRREARAEIHGALRSRAALGGLLVEWMLELELGMAHREHRARRLLHYSLGNATNQHVREAGASVRADDDQVGLLGLRGVNDFQKRRADLEHAAHLLTAVADAIYNFVELALREQALLFRKATHCANVHRRAEFWRHNHRRKRLIDMEENNLGAELARKF